jgi:hypothetical protein
MVARVGQIGKPTIALNPVGHGSVSSAELAVLSTPMERRSAEEE